MPAPASAQSPLNFVSGNSQRLLPKTAFAPLRLLPNPKHFGFGFVFYYLADFVSLATAFFRSEQTPSRTHSAAPPFQIEPAALGFNLGFFILGQSPFGFVSGNSQRLLPKTALTSLPLLPNPKYFGFGFVFSLFLHSPFGFVSGNSLRLLPETAFASLCLLSNPKPTGFGFVFSLLFTDL